jgi:hypothetical protein
VTSRFGSQSSVGASLIAGAWGAAEASIFFVVPDVPVGLISLVSPKRAATACIAATAGGVLGALGLHAALQAGWDPEPYFARVPGIRPADAAAARDAVAAAPIRAFALAAFSGVPVKLFVAGGSRLGLPTGALAGLTLLNRAPRLAVAALLMRSIGRQLGEAGVPRAASAGAYLAVWSVFYAWYWRSRARVAEVPRGTAGNHDRPPGVTPT